MCGQKKITTCEENATKKRRYEKKHRIKEQKNQRKKKEEIKSWTEKDADFLDTLILLFIYFLSGVSLSSFHRFYFGIEF